MKTLTKLAPDLMLIAGAAAVSYGAWAVYPPAGWIVAGAFTIYAGMRLA